MSEILSAFGVQWEILLFQATNFGLLLVGLWYFLYRPIIKIIDERQKLIEQGVKDAQKAAEEKHEIEEKKEEILSGARKEGQEIVSKAKEHAKEHEAEILKDAQHKAEGIIQDAQKVAEAQKREILAQSKEEIAKAAILAAERILRNKA